MIAISVIELFYLLAAVLFVLGLKGLTHPRTAVRGNSLAAAGMLVALLVTLLNQGIARWDLIIAGIVVGSAIGVGLAVKIQMTAMPQLVALFNAFGGGSSVLVAGVALMGLSTFDTELRVVLSGIASAIIGAITFSGSMVAFAKLQGLMREGAIAFRGQQLVNTSLAIVTLLLGAGVFLYPGLVLPYWILSAAAFLLGIVMVMRIGGADMPVVIALLNSFSGLAACAAGFVLNNDMLIIAGSLVGASGIILTQIMCKAMNRSLANVLFSLPQGQMVKAGKQGAGAEIYEGKIKASSADEVAMLMDSVQTMVIVPGYGLAVAQAQHPLKTLVELLEKRGVHVEFGIHPVAGRMPGHMNVLLAEAEVSYDQLKEMDVINPSFPKTDLVLVVGANDVVNPLANTDPNSPIAGMPILNVFEAKTVVVIKRSLSPGFAGVANPLFAADNTLMLFADAKQAINELIQAVKDA